MSIYFSLEVLIPPLYFQFAWRRNALLPMEPVDAVTDAWQLGEAIKDNILAPNNYSYTRIYDTANSYDNNNPTNAPGYEDAPCNTTNVTNSWANNRYGLVVWFTHGIETEAIDVFVNTDAVYLDDNYPSFTFQTSRETA
ncbi:MAG: hypothetical protein GY854_32760 [Deltaproteobacteria bacterium]|nr:hypothetical protein [Deltaproteobacteria bacterium]